MIQIEHIQIPVLLPKRGKGHQEILASFCISTSRSINPLDLVPFITSCSYKTCMVSDIVDLSRVIVKELHLEDINIQATFSYILDRVSPGLSPTFFSLPCFYERQVGGQGANTSWLGVTVPIQTNLGKPLASSLTLQIEHPQKIFFEDMVDRIYKILGTTLQPIISDKDVKMFLSSQEPCYTPEEVLALLKKECRERKYGKGGKAIIEVFDLYHIHKLTFSKSWKGKS